MLSRRSLRWMSLTKATCGRRSLVDDNLQWKTTFGGRRSSVVNTLRWKTPFSWIWPLLKDNLLWILACCIVSFAAFFTLSVRYVLSLVLQKFLIEARRKKRIWSLMPWDLKLAHIFTIISKHVLDQTKMQKESQRAMANTKLSPLALKICTYI